MKLSLTITNIYRVMEYEGSLKTNTITDRSNFNKDFMFYCFRFLPNFFRLTSKGFNPSKLKKYLIFFPIFTSGPTVIKMNKYSNFSSSNYSIIRALHSICEDPILLKAIQAFGELYDLVPK
jgi:hypothetical protein